MKNHKQPNSPAKTEWRFQLWDGDASGWGYWKDLDWKEDCKVCRRRRKWALAKIAALRTHELPYHIRLVRRTEQIIETLESPLALSVRNGRQP